MSDRPTLAVLVATRRVITDPQNHKRGLGHVYEGGPVCALGALRVVVGFDLVYEQIPAYKELRAALQQISSVKLVGTYNETHSHAEVLELYDLAISNVERRQRDYAPAGVRHR